LEFYTVDFCSTGAIKLDACHIAWGVKLYRPSINRIGDAFTVHHTNSLHLVPMSASLTLLRCTKYNNSQYPISECCTIFIAAVQMNEQRSFGLVGEIL